METINLFLAVLLIFGLGQGCVWPGDLLDDPNYTQDDKEGSRRSRRANEEKPRRKGG